MVPASTPNSKNYDDEELINKTLRFVETNAHPLKVKLLTLLSIYGKLSTSDLVEKTGKTKPTVLKHLEELERLDQVTYEEVASPGKYNMRVYSRLQPDWTIKGQDLKERVKKDPQIALVYANYQLAVRYQLKEIIDQTVTYQERMVQEVEKLVEKGDGDALLDLFQDNLGSFSLSHLSKSGLLERYMQTTSDEAQLKELRRLHAQLSSQKEDQSQVQPYLNIQLLLPIQRVIEQLAMDQWTINGSLWPNNPDFISS